VPGAAVPGVIEQRVGRGLVVFTGRHGGVSRPPYDSANLAEHVGDEEDAVLENRRRAARALGLPPPETWVTVRQVHGGTVVNADGPGAGEPADADAVVTTVRELALVIFTADCAPIALVADDAVAAVHAGWGGLEAGIVEHAVDALRAVTDTPVRAVIGPCIRPAQYEFGADLLARLVARFGDVVASTTTRGTPALDIPAAVRVALERSGVDDVEDVGVCTASSADHFSYRRDGTTGRQAMFVVLS
jgi:polyphenol oxidase